jgi:glycerate 2-kinase
MRVVIAPTAFKHSLSPRAAASAIERGLARSLPGASLVSVPIADGGDGFLDTLLSQGGERIACTALDPRGRPIEAAYGLRPDGTAIIEMALASGIALLGDAERDPMTATSYGTGQLLAGALASGARRIVVGLGGSATVDGGAGALAALGVRFLNGDGRPFDPVPARLPDLASVDLAGLDPRWREVQVLVAADVDNPPTGPAGAAAVFGPQKGARPPDIARLELALERLLAVLAQATGADLRQMPAGGAAGGMAAGLAAVLNARILPGFDLVSDELGLPAHLAGADWLVTGEGKLDGQSLAGKGPIAIARLARQLGVRTAAIVGDLAIDEGTLAAHGIDVVIPLVTGPMTSQEAIAQAPALLERAAFRFGAILALARA